jgi:RHS repeat-associated protein
VGIRSLVNGAEVSNRRFLWCDDEICEERTSDGAVSKRFFVQGMKAETAPTTGTFYYIRDHLGSVREMTDSLGNIRARFSYDPFGRITRVIGDLDADFMFAGMFWLADSGINMTLFRAYGSDVGRWLSRDPLKDAEKLLGPNLYAYVDNNPINWIDPRGTGPLEFFGCLLNGGKLGDCFGDEKERFRCRQVKQKAIEDCTKDVLENKCYPSTGNHQAFWDCVSGILRHAGCLPPI